MESNKLNWKMYIFNWLAIQIFLKKSYQILQQIRNNINFMKESPKMLSDIRICVNRREGLMHICLKATPYKW